MHSPDTSKSCESDDDEATGGAEENDESELEEKEDSENDENDDEQTTVEDADEHDENVNDAPRPIRTKRPVDSFGTWVNHGWCKLAITEAGGAGQLADSEQTTPESYYEAINSADSEACKKATK